jgi:hypothetical protein
MENPQKPAIPHMKIPPSFKQAAAGESPAAAPESLYAFFWLFDYAPVHHTPFS